MAVIAEPAAHDDEWVEALRSIGFSEAQACRAVSFIPSGLSRPLLERLGVTVLPDIASIPLGGGKKWMEIRLSDQPEFVAAVSGAREHFENACLPHHLFETIVLRSAEVDVISRALDAGVDVRDGAVASAFQDMSLARYVVRPSRLFAISRLFTRVWRRSS